MYDPCSRSLVALWLLLGACDGGASSHTFVMPAGALTVYDRSAQAFGRRR